MLGFLRKYQKIFFIVVAVVVIASFSFFGTHSQMQETGIKRGADPVGTLAKIIDHPYFGNSVIERQLLQSGMGSALLEMSFDELKEEMEERFERAKHVQLYSHPQASFLSVEGIWEHVNPELLVGFKQLKERTFDLDSAKLMMALYLAESATPADMVKQYLFFQQRQYNWVQPDNGLYHAETSIFPEHTLESWFGRSFVRKFAEFFIEGSLVAEAKGYAVSLKEAHEDFIQMAYTAMARSGAMSYDDVKRQLIGLGVDLGEATELWQKVMVTKRYLSDHAESVYVDPLVFREFHEKAAEKVEVELVQVPKAVVLKTEKEVGKFAEYLKKVGVGVGLPTAFKSVQDLQMTPFVEKVFEVEMASVSKEGLALGVSLQETWAFEEENEALLKAEFPEVATKGLDGIDEQLRLKVDEFARLAIIAKDKTRVQVALESAPMEKKTLQCSLAGPFPLDGIKDPKALLEVLEEKGEVDQYTQDEKHIYRINVIESKDPEVITYERALEKELLEGKDGGTNPLIAFMKKGVFEASQTLADQWLPVTETVEVKRSKTHPLIGEEVFAMDVDSVSQVIEKDGEVFFYRVKGRGTDERDYERLVMEKQKVLANEAMCHYAKELLKDIF